MNRFSPLLLLTIIPNLIFGQFTLNGSATNNGNNCFTLTPALISQAGSVWYTNSIDLSQSFEFSAQINLGCNNGGADGMVFAFQAVSTNVGGFGGGMGYNGITPSIGIEFDTYQNANWGDPASDHMAIISNGNVSHFAATNLVGPVDISPTGANVEDCNSHSLHVSWDPVNDSLKVYFDCNLRLEYNGDIINTIFGGNPTVFWGFTAGTGALTNVHSFCVNYLSFGLDTLVCENDTLQLAVGGGSSYSWSPAAGLSATNIPNPLAFPSVSTTYTATITDVCGFTRTETFVINIEHDSVLDVFLGNDTILCPGQSLLLDAYRPGPTYLWQNGSTDSVITVSTAGTYWVELENICGTRRDSITVTSEVLPTVSLGNDTTLCAGSTLQLDATFPGAEYVWQNGSANPTFTVNGPGTYYVSVVNFCDIARDTIVVSYESPPLPVDLGNDTILCDNNTYTLNISQPGVDYLWQNGSANPAFTISAAGTYWAEVSNLCGTDRDSIVVTYDQTPDINLGNDTTVCDGEVVLLNASWTPGSDYEWQDGSFSAVYIVTSPGTYTVTVSNVCGTDVSSRQVDYLSPPAPVNFGPDTVLCINQTMLLSPGQTGMNYLWQNGSAASTYTIANPGTYWVEVSNMCGSESDTINAQYTTAPMIDLGEDTVLCEGESITIDASWPGGSYLWDDLVTTPQRTITASGVYHVTVFHHCGDREDEIAVDFISRPAPVDLGADVNLCEGDTLMLDVTQPNVLYHWQNGSIEPSYTVRRSTDVRIRVYNQCGEETDDLKATYYSIPEVSFGADTTLCEGDEFVLDASQGQPMTYRWQDGSEDSLFVVSGPGFYTVTASNICGVDGDSVLVNGHSCFCAIHAPTAFSPNFDGYNDEFQLFYQCDIVSGTLKIFNRWGDLVFQADSPDQAWDGIFRSKGVPEGVYVWVFDYEFRDVDRVRTISESGTVTVLR